MRHRYRVLRVSIVSAISLTVALVIHFLSPCASALDAQPLRESYRASSLVGAPCPLLGNTNGSAANLRWYNVCSGYIWTFAGFAEGDAVGVRFGGPEQPAVNDGNIVKRTITYYRNVTPGYSQTVDVHVDVDTDGDGCPDVPYLDDLDLDPGLRWNCSEFNAPIPSGATSLIVRTQLDSDVAPSFATDGPFNNVCEPFGAARSFYYPANSSLCLPWDGPTARADNFLCWLVVDGDPSPPVPVACCLPDDDCQVLLPQDCIAAGGDPLYDLKDCAGVDCVTERACCFPDQTCEELRPPDCEAAGGTPQPEGIDCASSCPPSPPATEACCLPSGACFDRTVAQCQASGGQPMGPGTACATTTCPAPTACCFPNGACEDRVPESCIADGGSPQPAGTNCATFDCPDPGPSEACCFPDFSCIEAPVGGCPAGSIPQGPGTNCSVCPPTPAFEACCFADGSCVNAAVGQCPAGAVGQGSGTDCSPNPCGSNAVEPMSWGRIKGLYR